ncbi:MAG: hypothetical protein JW885_03405 [Deltaproteobacteria bacterium]|nr:hypothetical protein [Candidatus Zymogenaceae bacterium]
MKDLLFNPNVTVLSLDRMVRERRRTGRTGLKPGFVDDFFDMPPTDHIEHPSCARRRGDAPAASVNVDSLCPPKAEGLLRPIKVRVDRPSLPAAMDAVYHVVVFDETESPTITEKPFPGVSGGAGIRHIITVAENPVHGTAAGGFLHR